MLRKELNWFYQDGTSNIFPDAWEKFIQPIDKTNRGDLISAYYEIFIGDDEIKN